MSCDIGRDTAELPEFKLAASFKSRVKSPDSGVFEKVKLLSQLQCDYGMAGLNQTGFPPQAAFDFDAPMAAPRKRGSIPNVSPNLDLYQHISDVFFFFSIILIIQLLTEWRFFGGSRDQSGAGANPQHHHHLRVQPLPPARAERFLLHVHANSQRQRGEGGVGIRTAEDLQPIRAARMDQLIRDRK